jgi:nitrous oxidase accessory protein NosD
LAEVEAIHDVIIENNEFQDRAGTVLFLGGASKVVVNNNRMIAAAGAELRRNGPAIRIECSSRVSLSDNVVSDPRAGTTAAVEIAPNVAQGERGIRISGLDTTLGAQTHAIDDRRAAP